MRLTNTTVSRLAALATTAALTAAVLAGPATAAGPGGSRPGSTAAAALAPDGHAGVNVRVTTAAATAAPDGHAAVNATPDAARILAAENAASTVTATSGTTASASAPDDSTPWAAIGLGAIGLLLLAAGTTLLVRRHDSGHRHAAPGV